MEMNDLIRMLVEAYGPSGFEDRVRDLIRPLVEPQVDELWVDAMGNLIARRQPAEGDSKPLKVMVAAHMDEIGVMASHVTEKGFLRFTQIGGVMPQTLLGGRVRFAGGAIANVTASRVAMKRERKIRFFQADTYVAVDYGDRSIRIARRDGWLH